MSEFTRTHKALAKAASTDESRPSLQAVHADADFVTATDGHILLSVPQSADDPLPAGLYDAKALQAVKFPRKSSSASAHRENGALLVDVFSSDDHMGQPDTTYTVPDRSDAGPFPNYKAVIPTAESRLRVVLGISQLKKIIAALSDGECDAIEFDFPADSQGACHRTRIRLAGVVSDYHNTRRTGVTGVMMPRRPLED